MPRTRNMPAPARRPSQFNWRIWRRVLVRVMSESDKKNIALFAAGVAFYAILSIFPALAALIAVWGVVADPAVLADHLDVAQRLLPAEAFRILTDQVDALVEASRSTLQITGVISILVAIWTGRNGVAALIRGLNSIYREAHRPNPVRRFATAVLLTLILISVGIFAFASVVVLPALLALVPVRGDLEAIITLGKWLVVLLVVFFGICLLYRYGPNRRAARVPWITSGALVALFFWAVGSALLSLYLRNFGSFNEVYGSLGAAIALLFWLYLSAYVVLMGAQLNAELELATFDDTTVGEDHPPGSRRAFVADYAVDDAGQTQLAEPPEADKDQSRKK